MSEGVVDLSGAPQHTGWGEGSELGNETAGDFGASHWKADQTVAPVSTTLNIKKALTDAEVRLERLFDGDAALDDVLALLQDLAALAAARLEVVDLRAAFAEVAPDPGYLASAMVKWGLEFLISYVQPIQDLVGMMLGNPERITVTSVMWLETCRALVTVSEFMGRTVVGELASAWQGAAADAAVQRFGEMQDAVTVSASLSQLIAELMKLTAEFAEALNNRAKTFIADLVGDFVNALLFLLSPDPITKADAIFTAVMKIQKLTLEAVNLALQAARVYVQAAMLLTALVMVFEQTVALLDRMAEGC